MIEIRLSSTEMKQACEVGLLRQFNAIQKGYQDSFGFGGTGWSEHLEGAMGEMAFCKALEAFYEPRMAQFHDGLPDVGERTEVRTRSRHGYDLIVRPEDHEDRVYWLVTGKHGHYQIQGGIKGRDAKQEKWKATHGGRSMAYFVPKKELRCLSLLPGYRA